jgi:hypothetical protein
MTERLDRAVRAACDAYFSGPDISKEAHEAMRAAVKAALVDFLALKQESVQRAAVAMAATVLDSGGIYDYELMAKAVLASLRAQAGLTEENEG